MKITVTGGDGFLGKHLISKLKELDHDPYSVSSKAYDLRRQAHVDALFKHTGKPDIIYHLAANVGGIQYNLDNPATIYYDNVMMNTYLTHKSMLVGVGKFVFVGSVCSYPKYVPIPTRECHLWEGYPEESNGPYGVSKLAALVQLQAYHKQFGLNFAYPILANLYGPGDGGFFNDNKSHVVPALTKRILDAKEHNIGNIQIWGDGTPTRDLLYVKDAVEALSKFIEMNYNEPINIASGNEISINRLAHLITEIIGYDGELIFDKTKPVGQVRRCYDADRAKNILNWAASTSLVDGLKETIEWYRQCFK